MSNSQKLIFIFMFLVFLLPFLLLVRPQIWPQFELYYGDAPSKATFFQTLYTIISSLTVLVGVYQFVTNINKKIEPDLFVNNSKTIKITNLHAPYGVSMRFCIFNKGQISIKPDDVNLNINIDENIIFKITSGLINDNGDEVIPRISTLFKDGIEYQRVGGFVKTKVFPKRLIELFTAKLTFPNKGDYIISYYFTTDIGFFPKNSPIENNEPTHLGEIKVIIS